MRPGVGGHHNRANLSNPFNNFPTQPNSHFSQHIPSQHAAAAAFGGHLNGAFAAGAGSLTNGPGGFSTANGLGNGTGLSSHEAQMGFLRGAALQQAGGDMTATAAARAGSGSAIGAGLTARIRDVYKHNMAQEMQMIRSLVDRYPYVSMDTEFPGVVARPMGNFPSKADYHYQCLRTNVDMLNLIQLGITLWSPEGDLPPQSADTPLNRAGYANNLVPCPCTWQFNFSFSTETDMYSADSINLLREAGVDFERARREGISPRDFGSQLITSGLVLDPSITWLSFHSGYDFGYLVKIMGQQMLPADQDEYLKVVRKYFPRIYDIKYLFRNAQRQLAKGVLSQQASNIIAALGQKSGLQDIANELGCTREGRAHQAGSDAWLTGLVFWAMRSRIFDNDISDDLIGQIWGLSGVGPPASAATQQAAIAGHQTPHTNGATLFNTGMTPTYRDGPTTPQTNHSGLAGGGTPGTHGGMGALGTAGVFSNFASGGYGR